MSVLVNTPVWSLALRRSPEPLAGAQACLVAAWAELIRQRQVTILGPVRQEVLSGIRDDGAFERLRSRLRAFPDEPLGAEDCEHAAWCGNVCRRKGVAGSAVDFPLCAAALRRNVEIFTTDDDSARYARLLPLRTYRPRP